MLKFSNELFYVLCITCNIRNIKALGTVLFWGKPSCSQSLASHRGLKKKKHETQLLKNLVKKIINREEKKKGCGFYLCLLPSEETADTMWYYMLCRENIARFLQYNLSKTLFHSGRIFRYNPNQSPLLTDERGGPGQ